MVCVLFAVVACSGGRAPLSAGPGPGTTTGNACIAQPLAPRRVLRLSLAQVANAIGQLIDPAAADLARTAGDVDPTHQTYVPLASVREGQTFSAAPFGGLDAMAQAAAQHVFDDFSALAGCAPATDGCAQAYVTAVAEKAYRRPLDPDERDELIALLADSRTQGATVEESAQYAVYAVLLAPQFVYRSELGDLATASPAGDVALGPYEVATELAFLTQGGLPDATLLEAAREGRLGDAAGVSDETARLLSTPEARRNLDDTMVSYYRLNLLDNVVIDPAVVPTWSTNLAADMALESRLFLDDVLWNGALTDVLTSGAAFVNADLATGIYGIPAPAGGSGPGDFVRVDLPADQRAGIFTRAGFITSLARTDVTDLVARGLAIHDLAVCGVIPSPPDDVADVLSQAKSMTGNSARAQAEWRATQPKCAGCHDLFDPYGIALEGYDIIGRVRVTDEQGRAIDTRTTLPAALGGQPVKDAVDLSSKLAASPRFLACQAKSMLEYALNDPGGVPVALDSCAVSAVADGFRSAGDLSFAGLIRQVTLSPATLRRLGGN